MRRILRTQPSPASTRGFLSYGPFTFSRAGWRSLASSSCSLPTRCPHPGRSRKAARRKPLLRAGICPWSRLDLLIICSVLARLRIPRGGGMLHSVPSRTPFYVGQLSLGTHTLVREHLHATRLFECIVHGTKQIPLMGRVVHLQGFRSSINIERRYWQCVAGSVARRVLRRSGSWGRGRASALGLGGRGHRAQGVLRGPRPGRFRVLYCS